MVGLSGGVDSAVTALQMVQAGHEVQGLFMQNWRPRADDPYCTAEQDLTDARAVCDVLGIPLQVVDFSQQYLDRVFQRCLDDFAAGFTPNPDILCNREIKFSCMLQHARSLGGDYLATGHYAQHAQRDGQELLCRGVDLSKDQSYFLAALDQQQLAPALFPLGNLHKSAVRRLALEAGLPNAQKPDSTGICFIGERRFKPFLAEYILAQPGRIEDETGHVMGQHDGLMFYTLGQRKGLGIGGRSGAAELPWFVLEKRLSDNVLVVGQGREHPKLLRHSLRCANVHWIAGQPALRSDQRLHCQGQIRYRQAAVACQLWQIADDAWQVEFAEAQWAITPGQIVVFYADDTCLGSATILTAI